MVRIINSPFGVKAQKGVVEKPCKGLISIAPGKPSIAIFDLHGSNSLHSRIQDCSVYFRRRMVTPGVMVNTRISGPIITYNKGI